MKKVMNSSNEYGRYKWANLLQAKNNGASKRPIKEWGFITQFVPSAIGTSLVMVLTLTLTACEKTPPDYRAEVTLPEYTAGDAVKGKLLYKDACTQCHQLTPGLNKKGPQLLNVYGAAAAELKDYNYSQSLQNTGWTWDAETLDTYIADPVKVLPDSKMLSDPIPNATERTDIIAYLSTLRAPVPTEVANPDAPPNE